MTQIEAAELIFALSKQTPGPWDDEKIAMWAEKCVRTFDSRDVLGRAVDAVSDNWTDKFSPGFGVLKDAYDRLIAADRRARAERLDGPPRGGISAIEHFEYLMSKGRRGDMAALRELAEHWLPRVGRKPAIVDGLVAMQVTFPERWNVWLETHADEIHDLYGA